MARSLIDLFKGSEFDGQIVDNSPSTFIEQETNGIRRASGVDVNNPLIYGNEAIRIGTRSTPSLELMKEGTQGPEATGGIIGKGLSILSGGKIESLPELRNSVNSFLGIPQPPLPSRVAKDMENGMTAQEAIDNTNGTEFGKFLKQTGGGNPETIAKQAVGNAIELAKDKARKFLFGSPLEPGMPSDKGTGPSFGGSNPDAPFSEVEFRGYNSKNVASSAELAENYAAKYEVNLSDYSPVYGVERNSKKVGNDTDYAVDTGTGPLSKYEPSNPYSDTLQGQTLEDKRGLSNTNDAINETPVGSEPSVQDLIPFWISRYEDISTKIHFRSVITGISENVSPSWNSGQFFGNPYSFYTYGGVERSVSFNLLIYCMNENELATNWQKIKELTKLTYPDIKGTNLVDPPIIEFRLGDIYNQKPGYIESLTYTIPDNGTWEIDGSLVPKFIEVAIGIKFIEVPGDELTPYNVEMSKAATDAVNRELGGAEFDTSPQIPSLAGPDFAPSTTRPKSTKALVDSKGVKLRLNDKPKAPKDLTGIKTTAPFDTTNPIKSEPKYPLSIEEQEAILNRNVLGRPEG